MKSIFWGCTLGDIPLVNSYMHANLQQLVGFFPAFDLSYKKVVVF